MRAAVLPGPGERLSIEELTLPDPGPTQVVMEMGASGLCHTDVGVAEGSTPIPVEFPLVLGHEGAGVILEVGSAVTGLKPGDRVIVTGVASCGECYWCLHGQAVLCVRSAMQHDSGSAGRSTLRRSDGSPVFSLVGRGTFAQAIVLEAQKVVRIESELPMEQLALLGCGVTTGVGAAINTAKVAPGSSVAVFGGGGVGQSIVQGARIAGAARIVLIDPIEFKRETALRLGATHALDPDALDPAEGLKELTSGRGVDYAFEGSGNYEAARCAFASVRRGGTMVLVGSQPAGLQPPWTILEHLISAKKVIGSMGGSGLPRRDFPTYLELAESGQLDLASLISRRISLDEVNEGLQAIIEGTVIRSVIVS